MERNLKISHDADVLNTAFKIIDEMEKQILTFSEVDNENSIFKLQRNLLKDIALVKTIFETNSIDILNEVTSNNNSF